MEAWVGRLKNKMKLVGPKVLSIFFRVLMIADDTSVYSGFTPPVLVKIT